MKNSHRGMVDFYGYTRLGFPQARLRFFANMEWMRDERVKQVTIGASIFLTLSVAVMGFWIGWKQLPGVLGEWVGLIVGIMTTPFFMETSFILLGLVTVISINNWRRSKDGDDFVYLDQVTGPGVPTNLPEQAKWAIYREMPLPAVNPTPLTMAEGAFAIGDYAAASEWIGSLSHNELKQPATLRLRLELARATGRDELVAALEKELEDGR
jgi:hypothetical protein